MELFTKEIEEINIVGYGMSKVEEYYYLTLSDEDSVAKEEVDGDQLKDKEESGQEPISSDDVVVEDEAYAKTQNLLKKEGKSDDITEENSSRQDPSAESPHSKTEIKKASPIDVTPDSLEGEAAFHHENNVGQFQN